MDAGKEAFLVISNSRHRPMCFLQKSGVAKPYTCQSGNIASRCSRGLERLALSPAEFKYSFRLKSNDNCAMDDEEAERLINIFDKAGKIRETQL